MTSRSKQKIKFECTLAFDRQRATSVILHFLIVPRLCSNIHKKKLVGRWDTFPRRFSYLYLESNHHDRVDDTYDLGLHVFARWVDKLPATC